jgi:hypothetical protein
MSKSVTRAPKLDSDQLRDEGEQGFCTLCTDAQLICCSRFPLLAPIWTTSLRAARSCRVRGFEAELNCYV